jgi:myo-inositol 2-dehydrogenase/D-chiro-inositol 1-dehydrogenase
MEYRYIPGIAKLLSFLPEIGDLKMVTIRENRYPFLHEVCQ